MTASGVNTPLFLMNIYILAAFDINVFIYDHFVLHGILSI